MGMFDTFSGFEDKCPGCRNEITEYQTKMFVCEFRIFKKGSKMRLEYPNDDNFLEISHGKVTAYEYCDKCQKMVLADIVISNGEVVSTENLRFEKELE